MSSHPGCRPGCRPCCRSCRRPCRRSGPGPVPPARVRPEPAEGGATRRTSCAVTSDLEELGFLVLHEVVDLGDVARRDALELLLGAPGLVLAGLAVLDDALQLVHRRAPHAADRHLGVLALAARDLDHLPAALL